MVARVLGLRHDDSAHAALLKRLADAPLALVALVALGHHDAVAAHVGLLFDARKNGGEIVVGYLGHDDAYHPVGRHAAVAKTLGQGVRIEIMFARVGFDALTLRLTDARTVLQRTADGGHAHTQLAGNILHRDVRVFVHRHINYVGAKIYKNIDTTFVWKYNRLFL